MRKILVTIMFFAVLLVACNKDASVIPPLPPDQSIPTLNYEFVSIASTIKFTPFGDTLPDQTINKGYKIQLSDTNESVLTACSGIVSSIITDNAGGNIITLKYKRNSIYSFTYAGITRVQVHVNDSLGGGKIIGKISGSGVVDFQIIRNNTDALCPQTYGSPGFNTSIQQAVSQNNSLHPADSVLSPCLAQSLPK